MSKLKLHRFLILLPFFYMSCNSIIFDTEEELWSYIKNPDNDYLQRKTINGIHFELLYKPTDLMVKQEISNDFHKGDVALLRREYGDYLYFILNMSKSNQELLNSADKEKISLGAFINTLTFGMNKKLHLRTEQNDTIELVDYVYPRMYGLSKTTSFLLIYQSDSVKNAEELTLSIEDFGFGTGEVKFKQSVKKINNQPSLRF